MNKSFLSKLSSLFLFLLLFSLQAQAQHDDHDHEKNMKRVQVAKIDQGQLKDVQLTETNAAIPAKVKSAVKDKVNPKEVQIKTSSVKYYDELGWYVIAELNADGQRGIFREKLQVKNNEFFLEENTEGEVCLISNCKKIVFAKAPERCKCEEVERVGDKVEKTHRVFTHIAH